MLSEEENLRLLRKHFVVALEPHPGHCNVPFGVRVWIYTSEAKLLMNHWFGTGGEYQWKSKEDFTKDVQKIHSLLEAGYKKEQDDLTKQIESLIKNFESDDAQTREKAVEELSKIGKKALPLLIQTRDKAKDEEVKLRCYLAIDGAVENEANKMYEKSKPSPIKKPPNYTETENPKLRLKPYDCVNDVTKFFPSYRFYFVSWFETTQPFGLIILTPKGEMKEDKIKGTGLLEEIKKLDIKIGSKEEATKFGLIWLALQYGCEDFKVDVTDHQNDVRY